MNISSITGAATSSVTSSPQQRHSPPEAIVASTNAQAGTTPVSSQAVQPVQETQTSRPQLEDAVKAVSNFVKSINNSLQFSVDDSSGRTVVQVIDSGTKEVIRQIPSEEMLAIAKALDGIKGLLVKQQA